MSREPSAGCANERDCVALRAVDTHDIVGVDGDWKRSADHDRHYLARPYYGSRRVAAWLATQGYHVNRKRVQRLMRLLGVAAIYQRPNTGKPAAAHKIYPDLLHGLAVERVNQVWCSRISYIPMARGFLYLVVIMDLVSFSHHLLFNAFKRFAKSYSAPEGLPCFKTRLLALIGSANPGRR